MLGVGTIAKKVFGTPNDRKVKSVRPLVASINALEEEFQALSDEAIQEKTRELAKRVQGGESLDAILPEAFANCREAARRALGLRAFDVQLMGGIFLHQGNIAEMKTGEGKTLVATFPAYLNALGGKGVHIVTVNDYLAKRDSEWMGKVYHQLGMTVGVVYPQQPSEEKRIAYSADVTYATNNELGFDYLRDNMRGSIEEMMQRGHNFAIVDEVDSILIDEARTPLIISGPSQDRSELYVTLNKFIPELTAEHYTVDEKQRNATFTEEGNEILEQRLQQEGVLPEGQTLYDPEFDDHRSPRHAGAPGAHDVPQGPALYRAKWRNHADRRIHRPHDAWPAPVRRPPSGDRGQGRRGNPARERDTRLGHVPELLPPLRQALWHDGHRGDGS